MSVGPCPACGNTPLSGHGHACVPKPPIGVPWPGKSCRTICADCRWMGDYVSLGTPGCRHENARDLVTGLPTSCRARNTGHCPDFEAKP
mgnify:CR=1 FL=1